MARRKLTANMLVLREQIKTDLLTQLKANHTTGTHFIDQIDDYMAMWDTKNMLISDINKRGATVKYDNGGGQSGLKKNDSVSELVKVNAQMLKLLAELGLKATEIKIVDSHEFAGV